MRRLTALLCGLLLVGATMTACPNTDGGGGQAAPVPVPDSGTAPPPAPAVESADAGAMDAPPARLNAELRRMKAEMPVSPEDKAVMDQTNAELAARSWGLAVDAPAPLFTLKDASGTDVVLGRYLARKQPVVLLFYRGEWCPYCNTQLVAMNEIYPEIQAAGGEMIAIAPEQQEFVAKMVDKHQLTFPVVSDPGSVIAEKYKVAYEVNPQLGGLLSKYGIDLKARNGSDKALLPHAAVYVIDGRGNISWIDLDIDYTVRAEPIEVLEMVKAAVAALPAPASDAK